MIVFNTIFLLFIDFYIYKALRATRLRWTASPLFMVADETGLKSRADTKEPAGTSAAKASNGAKSRSNIRFMCSETRVARFRVPPL